MSDVTTWRLVPADPTKEMIDAGYENQDRYRDSDGPITLIVSAAIAAARAPDDAVIERMAVAIADARRARRTPTAQRVRGGPARMSVDIARMDVLAAIAAMGDGG